MRRPSPDRKPTPTKIQTKKQQNSKTGWRDATYSVRWEEFVAHSAKVTCLALGRQSGRVMATGGEDRKIHLWAVGKSNCIMSLSGHVSSIECVKFGLNEEVVCAGSATGTIKIWDLEAAKIIRTLSGHKDKVKCVDFHPYGDFVASGSTDNNIKLWDKRRKGCIFTYKGHNMVVNSLKFSPDGRWIASGCEEGIIKLWDLPAGKLLTEFRDHTSAVTDLEFHPNEFLLASCSTDQFVKFWDLENYRNVCASDGDCGSLQKIYFNPSGECLFCGTQDILKVYAWEPMRTLDTLVMGWGKVSDITSSDNQLIVGAFNSTNVSVYIVDLKRIQAFDSWIRSTSPLYVHQTGNLLDLAALDEISSDYNDDDSILAEFEDRIEYPDNIYAHLENEFSASTGFAGLMNSTYTKAITGTSSGKLTLPTGVAHPYNYEDDKMTESASIDEQSLIPFSQTPTRELQRIFSDGNQQYELEIMPQLRTRAFDIELNDFLPKNLIESIRLGLNTSLEISDTEAISTIYRGHDPMTKVLSHRSLRLQRTLSIWRTRGALASLASTVQNLDTAIVVDILGLLLTRPGFWTLDMCQLLLPTICDLLKSKYESYITIGCLSLKLILKNFAHVIKINMTAPKSVGVDISREERFQKCSVCFSHLISIRSLLLQRQSMQGNLGQMFMELRQLLQPLER